ncbi:MAG: acyl dehydratase, partial [Solirubrobacteraceae bacterium]
HYDLAAARNPVRSHEVVGAGEPVPEGSAQEVVASGEPVPEGWAQEIEGGDVVDAAPALARLTLNVAMAHLDAGAAAHGRRLVYGGHTIGLAAAQATRALPSLVTILGWHAADHTAPVFEGDTLRSRLELERREPLPGGGHLLHLRSHVTSDAGPVLDWRFVAV